MKISLKWLSKYTDVSEYLKAPQKLSDILTNAGLEVEGIVDQSKQFEHVVIGQILEKDKHPNADQLTLCKVSTGDATHKIVCGAKNHNSGDKVVVALPGAVLPGNFAIKLSKIRGEESQGMLCSEKELGLATESEGILILPPSATVGEDFSKYSKSDDVIFDIKVTPNRSDCLSHLGLAREVAALTGVKNIEFTIPNLPVGRESTRKLIKVTVDDSERCPRYAGRIVQGVKVAESPEWLKKSLEAVGLRPINNVVDITNFVLMELGQPLHAFDLTKIDEAQILVRGANAGETFVTLDNKELKFDGTELLICDSKKPVALAGVMGGLGSGVTESTKDVFVESAYFLPASVRRSSRRHGIESDSSYRFSRGVDPDGILTALNRACQLLVEVAGGTQCADFYDIYPRPNVRPRIELDLNFISARLGIKVEGNEAKRLLERLGCDVSGSGQKLLVNPPAYRGDLKLAEDLGEEILRLKGFGQIPETLPQMKTEPKADDVKHTLERRLSQDLRARGVNQAVNLSFTHSTYEEKFFAQGKFGQTAETGLSYSTKSVKLKNPLNVELDVMRRSLVPSLVKNALHNIRHNPGQSHGALFEISPAFTTQETDDIREKRPYREHRYLALSLWGKPTAHWLKQTEIPLFYSLKGLIEGVLSDWQCKSVKFEALKDAPAYLHPGQSARVFVEGKPIGVVGVLHPAVADQLEVKEPMAVAELNLDTLFIGQPRISRMKPLSKFPTVERDVAFLMPATVTAGEVRAELLKAGGQIVKGCEVFDLYVGDKLPADKKSLALRLTYQDLTKTLSDEEVNAAHQKAISQVSQKLALTVR